VSQNPLDIPDAVLGQLGNRVQHALRAFTPRDQKAVRAAAETFRANPKLKIESVIMELGVGEALVSVLDEKGSPGIVERALVCPPQSRLGPLSAAERQALLDASAVRGQYEKTVDRESAYEILKKRAAQAVPAAATPEKAAGGGLLDGLLGGVTGPRGGRREGAAEAMVKSAARSIGSQIGRSLIRGVLGSLLGGKR
jgi:hypothetical protein